jgi:hypothetical protein
MRLATDDVYRVDVARRVHHVAGMPAQLPFWPNLASRETRVTRAEKQEIKKSESAAERAVRHRLQQRLSAKVALKDKGGRGSFTVHYTSYDELDEIMRRIKA